MTSEKIVLKEALGKFKNLTGGKAEQIQVPQKNIDGAVQISIGTEKQIFFIELRNEIRQAHISDILREIGNDKENWLLVSKYIPKPLKAKLKEENINYLEAAGNCFIHAGPMLIYINDQQVTPGRKPLTGKLWKQSGLKFLLAILTKPSLLNESYRKISDEANIALGNIGTLIDELKEGRYLEEQENELILINKDQLIQRWTEFYHINLRPKLTKGRFRFLRKDIQIKWKNFKSSHFYWGGEPGAELLTNFLQAESLIIYAKVPIATILKELKLVPDSNGAIELLESFWNESLYPKKKVGPSPAPPLLVYAELMATLDSRNWEAANTIKSKFLND